MAYTSWSVVYGEQPSAAKWNILGTNDASFNDGTGIATLGWNTTSLSNPYKFSVYRSAAWTTGNNAFAKVVFDTEVFDTNNNFATGTYTVPVSGFYMFNAGVGESSTTSSAVPITSIYKNGAEFMRGTEVAAGETANTTTLVGGMVQCAAGNTIEIYFRGNNVNGGASQVQTYFTGFLVSKT